MLGTLGRPLRPQPALQPAQRLRDTRTNTHASTAKPTSDNHPPQAG